MNDYIIYDGVDIRSFDAYVYERNTFSGPEKQYTTVAIPGRSGDFLLDGNRFGNVSHEYGVIIYRRFEENFENLRAFLMSRNGYCRLEDSIHPGEFYHAYFTGPIVPTLTRQRDMGKFTLTFNRKPQRFLLSGEEEIILRTGGSGQRSYVTNPTYFNCSPLLMLKGDSLSSGFQFYINDTRVTMDEYTGSRASYLNGRWVYIDFNTVQTYLKYSGTTYYFNDAVKYLLPSDTKKAFALSPGKNDLTFSSVSNAPEIRLIPRWYTI